MVGTMRLLEFENGAPTPGTRVTGVAAGVVTTTSTIEDEEVLIGVLIVNVEVNVVGKIVVKEVSVLVP